MTFGQLFTEIANKLIFHAAKRRVVDRLHGVLKKLAEVEQREKEQEGK